jgi:hypothetical protein
MNSAPTTFSGLVDAILGIISLAIPLIFSIIFLFIVWKIIDAWILNVGDEKKRSEGKNLVVIGVIVFVIMVSIWGVVQLIRSSLFS